jgi:hypothetical protein
VRRDIRVQSGLLRGSADLSGAHLLDLVATMDRRQLVLRVTMLAIHSPLAVPLAA